MRSSSRRLLPGLATVATLLFCAPSSFADEPAVAPAPASTDAPPPPALPPPSPPPAAPAPAPAAASTTATAPPTALAPDSPADGPADAPATEGDTRRAEGMRLGLELGFQRAFSGAEDRLNAGTPSLIPIGAELSFRTSPSLLLGFHGHAAFASRDDCIETDSCRARAYDFGVHLETPLGRGQSFVPFLRYGVGYEILYQGGAPLDPEGHRYRGAFDFIDLRVGGDFIVARGSAGKTTRIGGYVGFVGGFLLNQTGVSHLNGSGGTRRDLDRDSGSAHLWFSTGLRATLDP
jgi:hypothetical protein